MKIIPFILLLFFAGTVAAQNTSIATSSKSSAVQSDSTISYAAGAQFKATPWKELWWGSHYRKEWTTPVTFSVLHFNTAHGGLTPVRRGGGHQTKTLRLTAKDGQEYVLRSIDKNLDQLVPNELKGTYIHDLLNDQISTAHPYGPLAIAKLAEQVSILHTNPKIYYVPDDPALAEFRAEFANTLCLLEERPSGKGWAYTKLTHQADNIINSENLVEKVFQSTNNQVDQHAYLKVRLFDMMVNDWDRHEDQFIWAAHTKGNKTTYETFARDRDQAFSKTDGINLYFLSKPWALRSLQNMDKTVKDVIGHNLAAKYMDRQFLNELTRQDWLNVITSLQSKITDQSIKDALNEMPASINEISGDFIYNRLRDRRDNMNKYGMKYFKILNKEVSITGSDQKESFIINNSSNNEMLITGLTATRDTFFHRQFNRNETKEIRIYGLDGNDEFSITGDAKNKFRLRLIGGEGEDSYANNKTSQQGKKVKVYDSAGGNNLSRKLFHLVSAADTSRMVYNRKSFAYDWYMPLFLPGYNPDDGLFLGLGFIYRKQKWGKSPFAWEQRFAIHYAASTGATGLEYDGLFKQVFGKWDLFMTGHYNGPQYVFNFYGYGNNTTLTTMDKAYYRTRSKELFLNPGVSRSFNRSTFQFGPQFETVEVIDLEDRFISTPKAGLDSTVFNKNSFGGAMGKWVYSTIGSEKNPVHGLKIDAGLSYLHRFTESTDDLLRLHADLSFYLPIVKKKLSLAHRFGYAVNFGEYQFYQANTLGGMSNLRGYWRDRFAGTSAFYQNTELRYNLATLKGYILRGQLGIFGFIDDGRVWIDNENSNKFHVGYGGGCYFFPYNRLAFTVSYGASKETSALYIKTGLFF